MNCSRWRTHLGRNTVAVVALIRRVGSLESLWSESSENKMASPAVEEACVRSYYVDVTLL